VHVSFVRSISMDAFKAGEIARMDTGGNKRWQDFFSANSLSGNFEESTIKERYDSEVGEEWKERLATEVEGREFDAAAFKKSMEELRRKKAEKAANFSGQGSRSATPAGSRGVSVQGRTASPAPGMKKGAGITAEQKAQNENYFARMGEANASRPDGLPPSQGGKYAGFGSAMPEQQGGAGAGGPPGADEFSKDPVAALTKGFGWFGGMVSKQAKMVNDSYLQPTAKNVSFLPVLWSGLGVGEVADS
jgi:ADP-ribosylation factor GTPase-activating protein 1